MDDAVLAQESQTKDAKKSVPDRTQRTTKNNRHRSAEVLDETLYRTNRDPPIIRRELFTDVVACAKKRSPHLELTRDPICSFVTEWENGEPWQMWALRPSDM